MMNKQHNFKSNRVPDNFKALVNTVIPRSTGLAYVYGVVQYYGALDLQTDEYLTVTLNSFDIPLADPTAEMLDIVNESFITLDQFEQLYVLSLLNQIQINISYLPIPFNNNPQLVILITNSLISFTMMGYYSEWSGYGSTRLAEPNQRKIEYFPLSWKQIGYPGPSLGYRALRTFNFT